MQLVLGSMLIWLPSKMAGNTDVKIFYLSFHCAFAVSVSDNQDNLVLHSLGQNVAQTST